jgi:4-carboxymuconolactone decarboxylase
MSSNLLDQSGETYDKALKMRREVLGDAYVDRALAGGSDPFGKVGQDYTTEVCWGAWTRPGLTKQQRSLLNIGILMALNRGPELAAHTRGAINNGLTEEEIAEAIRHTMIYAGVPSGVEGFKIAGKVIKDMKEAGEMPKKSS